MRIRDGDSSDPGSWMEKSRIRDKHPGSATLQAMVIFAPRLEYQPLTRSVSGKVLDGNIQNPVAITNQFNNNNNNKSLFLFRPV